MTTTVTAKIQVRKGTAAAWTSANPVLLSGEVGFETDTLKLKIGDGTTAWISLAYHHDPDLAATYAAIAHTHSGVYEPADADLQAHLISTSNPHSVTAVQVGADASGTAAGLIASHEGAANPHPGYLTPGEGDAAYSALGHAHSGVYEAAGAISTHAAVTSSVHGISAFGATLVDDADAGTARSTLGLGTAATTDTTAYATAAHNHSGVYEPVDVTLLRQADVDDAPVNGVTTAPVSSNWAYDHAALTTAHGISSFGATLVDDADAATARSTLGLGTAAVAATGDFATTSHTHSGVYDPAGTASSAVSAHAGGSSVHAIASVTGLQTALDGKSATSHDHAATYAPLAKGVTNGDSHDHNGGDGGQIAYSTLSGLPTLYAGAASETHAATDKTTPVDADELGLVDSAASFALKKLSWANLKTTLASVFAALAGKSGGQTLIGGPEVTDALTLQGTSGNGTATAIALQMKVGNNGATSGFTLLNNGNVGLAGVTAPSALLEISGISGRHSLKVSGSAPTYTSSFVSVNQYGTLFSEIPSSGNYVAYVVQLAGDTYGRIGFGLDSGVPFLGLGPGVTTRDVFLKRSSSDLVFQFGTSPATKAIITSAGKIGAGVSSASAQLHAVATAEQLRLGYDATYYASFTVSSAGNLTIDTVGNTIYTPDTIENTVNGAGIILKSPDGTRYRLTVANGGTLSIAAA